MIQEFFRGIDPVAVLVDGDNLSHLHAAAILAEAARCGKIVLSRVYGDMSRLQDWGADPHFGAQHCSSVRGKNGADIRLVIDAMEHALAARARVFIIASNDSDFGPLAMRLREMGFMVVGVGGAQASRRFEAGCTKFLRIGEPVVGAARPVFQTPDFPTTVVPKALVTKSDVPPLDALDGLVRAQIEAHGKNGGIPLMVLGARLGKAKAFGAPTWRQVLGARPDRFILDAPSGEIIVRLHPDRLAPR